MFATSVSAKDDFVSETGAKVSLSGLQSGKGFDRFIVKFRDAGTSTAALGRRTNALTTAGRGLGITAQPLRQMAIGATVVSAGRKLTAAEAETFMSTLGASPDVEYVEVDRLNQPLYTPNDTRYGEQWHYFESTGGLNLPTAWDITTGAGTVVAVLDTGYVAHSDLAANIIAGYDFIVDTAVAADGNGRDNNPADPGDAYGGYPSSWHGTHVAGTVAAVTNNNKGVAGVAFGAKIQPVRVLGKGGGYDSDINDAIIWASGGNVSGVPSNATPADVINLSLGGTGACSTSSQTAINQAVNNGTTIVIASGNDNANVSGFSPGNCANIISVASNDKEGNRASYSNYGSLIDVTAPGGETATSSKGVLSTLNTGSNTPGSETYAFYQGTSMAAPHVAGVVALMQSVGSTKTPAQIETMLKNTARPLPGSCSGGCGAGIVDAYAAVVAAGGGGGGGNVAPVANYTFTTSGLTATFTNTSTDSDGTIASRSWNFGDGTTSTAASPSKTYSSAGTYNVTLTVTDDDGASNATTKSVTVTSGGGGGSVLSNGVPVTGISGAASSQQFWTINVPSGASNLVIAMSGGTGDADLYVRQGSAPTTSSYTCRPYLNGNNETCTIAAPVAGTYHVMIRGYSAFSGVSLVGSYTTGGGGGASFFENTNDYAINNNATVNSPIVVSGRSGNAPSNLQVAVNIVHTYRGDLKVDLVAPDGSVYVLHNRSGGSADNLVGTYTVNASSEAANGTWNLRVNDNANGDTGYINSWSLQF
ncbi:S8 family serine peptidase [Chiayiivirga flava]|uniref:S8 family serine peptidase n=1 Tax=Chiayiivirga flava TaxID=659595 RepID=UPI003CCD4576